MIVITGGIGSGKTFVCHLLERRGIRIYDCDAAAKRLIRTSADIQEALQAVVGDNVFRTVVRADGTVMRELQKAVLSRYLLTDQEHADVINAIVHPAVAADFEQSGYEWMETAIFFESGFYRRVEADIVVCVSAPLETRISRVMARDGIDRAKVLEWMARQLPQEVVAKRSDYEIVNDGVSNLEEQIDRLLVSMRSGK